MPFPASLQLITLTGDFRDGADDGNPREGVVTITLPTPIRSTGDNVIVPPFDLEIEMTDGTFSVDLPATTDPDWLPNTAEYVVQAVFSDDFRKLWWTFPLPHDTAGGTLDLADVGAPNVGTPSLTIRQGTSQPLADGGYKGTWSGGVLYRAGDTVQHVSTVYGALRASTGVTPGTNAAIWKVYPGGGGGGAVDSVFGRTGDVVAQAGDYTKAQVGLANVDNTSDASKPISTATQTALDGKQAVDADLTAIAALTPTNDDLIQRKAGAWVNRTPAQIKTDLALVKGDVGLGNVDNTSDLNKPISTATGIALDGKVDESLIDAKGDLFVGSGADAVGRLPVGTNGYALVADSAEVLGMRWASIVGGGSGGYKGTWAGATAYAAGDSVTLSGGVFGTVAGVLADIPPFDSTKLLTGTPSNTDNADFADYEFFSYFDVATAVRMTGITLLKVATQTEIPITARLWNRDFSLTTPIAVVQSSGVASGFAGEVIIPLEFDLQPGVNYAVSFTTGLGSGFGYVYNPAYAFPLTVDSVTLRNGGFSTAVGLISAVTTGTLFWVGIQWEEMNSGWTRLANNDPVETVMGTASEIEVLNRGSGVWQVGIPTGAQIVTPTLSNATLSATATVSGRIVHTPDVLTDAATIAIDASLGNDFTVTLTADRTLGAPTNPVNGQKILIAFRQDGTGGHTLTYNAVWRFSNDIPNGDFVDTAAGKTTYLGARYNGTDSKWDVLAFVGAY